MCIRDRTGTLLPIPEGLKQSLKNEKNKNESSKLYALIVGINKYQNTNLPTLKGCVCLLYTSDAADERSSVDLGGRRIIKKKKNKNNGGRELTDKSNDQWRSDAA